MRTIPEVIDREVESVKTSLEEELGRLVMQELKNLDNQDERENLDQTMGPYDKDFKGESATEPTDFASGAKHAPAESTKTNLIEHANADHSQSDAATCDPGDLGLKQSCSVHANVAPSEGATAHTVPEPSQSCEG